jgi:ribose transport system permease protein
MASLAAAVPALRALSPKRISAAYILVLLIVVFGYLRPHTFLTRTTFTSLLSDQAVVALIAVALVIPLAAELFDLSVGGAAALASVVSANQAAEHGQPTAVAIAIAILVGLLVGITSGVLVSKFQISSFIATLGMGSILTAAANAVSDQQDIVGLPHGFITLGVKQLFGIRWVVWIVLVLAVIVWFFLEHTPAGRYLYAIGGNFEASRLNGLRVDLLRIAALAACSTLCAIAGVLATAGITAGSSQTGPAYMLPAFAAAFLGSTQIKVGRVNVWGTVLAVYVLAVGVKGLQLMGAPFWLSDLFNGVALIVSVGLASSNFGVLARARKRLRSPDSDDPAITVPLPTPQASTTGSTGVQNVPLVTTKRHAN